MYSNPCEQHGHRYFIADVAQVTGEGKVVVIALCTSCGEFIQHEVIVSLPNAQVRLLKDKINLKE